MGLNSGFMGKEIGDRRYLTVLLPEGTLFDYQKRILEMGREAGLLEARFLQEEEGEWMMLDSTGFRPLSEALWEKREPTEVLGLLISLCERVRTAEEYLFFADELPLSLKCIYLNEDGNDLRLAYLPDFVRDGTFQEHFLSLLTELSLFGLPEVWNSYGTRLARQIREKNPGAKGILRLLSVLHRELTCDCDERSSEWRWSEPEIGCSQEEKQRNRLPSEEQQRWKGSGFTGVSLLKDWIMERFNKVKQI